MAGSAKIQCQKGVRRPALSAVSSRLLPCRWCKPCERVAIKNGACSACLYCIWDAMSIEMRQQQAQSAHIFECPEGICFLFCVSPGARGLAGWHFASGRQRRLNNCCASQWMIYRCIWIRFPMCWRARSCAQHSTRSATTHGLRILGRGGLEPTPERGECLRRLLHHGGTAKALVAAGPPLLRGVDRLKPEPLHGHSTPVGQGHRALCGR